MTNVTIQTAVEMESLKIDLQQQNIILENKAIRELGLGVMTPALVTLITEIYTNKIVLLAMENLKNGIQPDPNVLVQMMINLDRAPVMLKVIMDNQLFPTVANNGLIKLNKMQQDAQQAAIAALNRQNMNRQNMRGNNMYGQQPMPGNYMMGQPMMGNNIVQPMVTQPMGMAPQQMYPNMIQPMQTQQSVMASGVYNGKYTNATRQAPVMTPQAMPQQSAPDKYAKAAPVAQQPVQPAIPQEAIPSEEGNCWLCAPGVAINANGDAIGVIESDLVLTLDPVSIEGELKTNDMIKAALFNMPSGTIKKANYHIKKRNFTTSGSYQHVESRLLSYYTAKANVAFYYTLGRTAVSDVVADRDVLVKDFINKIVVIKDRAETEEILNKAIEETNQAKANIKTENSMVNNSIVEVNYEEVRPTYVISSDHLLETFVDVRKGHDEVVSLSKYSYPGVYNSLSKLLLDNNSHVDVFIASVKGYVYATVYQKDAQSDIRLAVIESKLK